MERREQLDAPGVDLGSVIETTSNACGGLRAAICSARAPAATLARHRRAASAPVSRRVMSRGDTLRLPAASKAPGIRQGPRKRTDLDPALRYLSLPKQPVSSQSLRSVAPPDAHAERAGGFFSTRSCETAFEGPPRHSCRKPRNTRTQKERVCSAPRAPQRLSSLAQNQRSSPSSGARRPTSLLIYRAGSCSRRTSK